MNNNKIELSGIFSDGYGIIPKKLMKMEIPNNVKLLLAYMLSYTGGGNSCFPSYDTISKHLNWSKSTIAKSINYCVDNGFIKKTKLNNNPLNHSNKYVLVFISNGISDSTTYDTVDSTRVSTHDSTTSVPTIVQQQYKNNNNINNNTNNNNNSLSDSDEGGLTKNELLKKLSSSYPASVSMKGGNKRSTQRSVFNREKAYKIIKEIGIDEAINIINMYIDDCNKNGTFIKNFKTLINNFPSRDDFEYTESEHEIIPEMETKNIYFEQFEKTQPDAQND